MIELFSIYRNLQKICKRFPLHNNRKYIELCSKQVYWFLVLKFMNKKHFKFIIVGAGISGLQAAINLAEMGQQFIVLEAQNRIGGRICTLTIAQALEEDGTDCQEAWLQKVKHNRVEVGATWVCEDNIQLRKLLEKYKLEMHEQYYKGKHILALTAEQKLHIQDYSEYYLQHKEVILPLIRRMWNQAKRYNQLLELKKTKKLTQQERNELQNIYNTYDSITGYEFILSGVKDAFLADLIDSQILTLQSISSRHFSALQFLLDDAGWHSLYYYLGIDENYIDGYRVDTGLSALIHAMKNNALQLLKDQGMEHLEDHIFRLNHPVAEIRNDLIPVQVITQKGDAFTCEKVIMCLPSGTFGKIKYGALSEGKRLLMENRLNSHTIRMTMVFPQPFWRHLNHSGSVEFSHVYPMKELVELSPKNLSCGIVAFVFFQQGFEEWNTEIDKQCIGLQDIQLKTKRYQVNKEKCLRVLADLYLGGDRSHQYLKHCAIFTRSLSYNPYIRDTYDSTTAPHVYKLLHENNLDHLSPLECDEPNMIILGSDFSFSEEGAGYMEGGIRIANRKITKLLLE